MLAEITTLRVRDKSAAKRAAYALLAGLAVYVLAVCTRGGQQIENRLLELSQPGIGNRAPGFSRGSFTPSVLPPDHVLIIGGTLILMLWMFRKGRLALWALLTLVGSCATASALKAALPRPALDPDLAYALHNSAPSGHVTAATALALILLVAAPRRLKPVAALGGTVIASLAAYFVQSSGWHRPSDVLTAVGITLFWAFIAQAFIFDVAAVKPGRNPKRFLLVGLATVSAAVAVLWASGRHDPPGLISLATAFAPCVAVAVLAVSGPGARPAKKSARTGPRRVARLSTGSRSRTAPSGDGLRADPRRAGSA
ncbi:phosphatase PAP2 family protein [Streptomyces sp. H27-H1]|uniref:phosphatase PAP2 family protein n=1 Tax=Streptomyces sp. H27-H1 TaxID=2996461 RepID=UPI00226DAF9C|nr:phosphatase PAP2 family protein [Streptomyces sp. H27-H1]MCY0932502.1 phosphatase PAP2 family protein [Streptomyces sp. H27-H1]